MPIILRGTLWEFPFFVKFFIFDIMEVFHSPISEVDPDFLGGLLLDHVEVNIQGKLFFHSFLVPICYHNSIYMSIEKKKIAGKSAIYSFDSSISLISASSDLLDRKSGAER